MAVHNHFCLNILAFCRAVCSICCTYSINGLHLTQRKVLARRFGSDQYTLRPCLSKPKMQCIIQQASFIAFFSKTFTALCFNNKLCQIFLISSSVRNCQCLQLLCLSLDFCSALHSPAVPVPAEEHISLLLLHHNTCTYKL